MKNLLKYILLLLVLSGCITTRPTNNNRQAIENKGVPEVDFSEQSTWLLGYVNKVMLEREPYASWYFKGYDEYSFNSDAVNKLTDISKEGLTIKIVMGTWCPDSRREVPRFMRILDLWHFPLINVTFIGVDNAKLSPVGEYEGLNIQRVPTFIIFKNNIEAGRIIENPTTSLEQDIVNILKTD
jgi:hypothetical protein